MKVTFGKNMNIDIVIALFTNIMQEYPDHTILQDDMSIIVTLENEIGQPCPDNNQEIVVGITMQEIYSINRKKAIDELKKRWKQYVRRGRVMQVVSEILEYCIDNDMYILDLKPDKHGRLKAVFVFNNINGYTGYFDTKGLHDGPYHKNK